MFVAVWRYLPAFSLAFGAGLSAQPALAHGHHHSAYSHTTHHYARAYGHRHAAFMVAAAPAPEAWGDQSASFSSTSFGYGEPVRRSRHRAVAENWQTGSWQAASWQSGPQTYWQHGWHGHMARQASLQQASWQQNGWQQNGWQQSNWQQQSWRQSRFARRQQAAFFGGPSGSTYYDYAAQSSWSSPAGGFRGHSELSGMIASQASAAGVPLSLAERVVRRESGGNPRAVHAGNYGLMQIRLGTARSMGYSGSASGLLDPSVNMTYAMRYLAGAYRAAGGNESRAVALYARGYHATPARVRTYTF
jgi:hypothetical protein